MTLTRGRYTSTIPRRERAILLTYIVMLCVCVCEIHRRVLVIYRLEEERACFIKNLHLHSTSAVLPPCYASLAVLLQARMSTSARFIPVIHCTTLSCKQGTIEMKGMHWQSSTDLGFASYFECGVNPAYCQLKNKRVRSQALEPRGLWALNEANRARLAQTLTIDSLVMASRRNSP